MSQSITVSLVALKSFTINDLATETGFTFNYEGRHPWAMVHVAGVPHTITQSVNAAFLEAERIGRETGFPVIDSTLETLDGST